MDFNLPENYTSRSLTANSLKNDGRKTIRLPFGFRSLFRGELLNFRWVAGFEPKNEGLEVWKRDFPFQIVVIFSSQPVSFGWVGGGRIC